jgi:outer membrane protein assembly factor BamE (lipoprotein component of BamABCDE complex)
MRRSLEICFVACLIVGLGGCASTGGGNEVLRNETEQGVQSKLKEGKSTKQDVRKLFGSPLKTSFTDSGLEIWTYEFKNISADAVAYIPIVNMFGATASGTKKELVVLFDRQGTVTRFSMAESEVKEKTGLFNR